MAHHPVLPASRFSPLRPSANVLFVLAATMSVVMLGWLVSIGVLTGIDPGRAPLQTTFPAWGLIAFGVWMALAIITSVLLPLLALVLWREQPHVRTVLLPYLGLLLVQIPTEMLFAQWFFPNIVAITGLIYTSYRVYQLWYGQRALMQHADVPGRSQALRAILLLGICFWTANGAFLVYVLITRVIHG